MQVEGEPGRRDPRDDLLPRRRLDLSAAEPTLTRSRCRSAAACVGPCRRDGGTDSRAPGRRPDRLLCEGLARLLARAARHGSGGHGRATAVRRVELAFRTRPDVAVLDVSMPDLSGIEVTRRLTAALPGMRVIGLSMHEEEDVALAMRAAGAAAYLTKGGSPDELIAAIRGHVPTAS